MVLVSDRLRGAKPHPRLPPRLVLAHSDLYISFRLARQVGFQLFTQPLITAPASYKIAQTDQALVESSCQILRFHLEEAGDDCRLLLPVVLLGFEELATRACQLVEPGTTVVF